MSENPSVAWGRIVIQGLADAGLETVVVCPGSRSTPLVLAAVDHPAIATYSLLDERSGAFFGVGYGKRTDRPAAIVCTSGTAGANMHPAVIEADRSRTPLVVCTADRPAVLQEAGANQTIDQDGLFGEAVRWAPAIPPADDRDATAVRRIASRAVARSRGPTPGPVHLNVPFRKPLEPVEAASTRIDPASAPTTVHAGDRLEPSEAAVAEVRDRLEAAERALIVAGQLRLGVGEGIPALAARLDVPLLADALSGIRFHDGPEAPGLGGYDAFLAPDITADWPRPDLVLQFGARPTSTRLRSYLAEAADEHVLVQPADGLADPEFAATDVVAADPDAVVEAVAEVSPSSAQTGWRSRFEAAEERYWSFVAEHEERMPPEGRVAHATLAAAPRNGTVFVSNSMPIRDVDRFGAPRSTRLAVLANRGASGIDGITSTALGAALGGDGHVTLLTGDLAFYHDMNGLLAIERCDVTATIIVLNNDGGGIFHMLPIADIDPPFSEHFLTPHGLDFAHAAELYGLPYDRVVAEAADDAVTTRVRSGEPGVLEIAVDADDNHARREAFQAAFLDTMTAE